MKRILLFIDSLSSGGAQRQMVALSKLLVAHGYDVFLVDYWDFSFYDEELRQAGVRFEHRLTKGKWNLIKMYIQTTREFQPDVVIAYLFNPSIIATVGRMLSRGHYRLIVSERSTSVRNNWSVRIRMAIYRFADVIVTNALSQGEFIRLHYPYHRKRTVVITNFVDAETFQPSKTAKSVNPVTRCLVVGRIVAQKNVLRFIQAVAKLRKKDYEFTIDWFGIPYPQSYYEECLCMVREMGLKDVISFHDSKKNIIEEYHKADIFILPSIYEGFPNVLTEAMSCGLPVVAGAVSDNVHIVDDGVNGLLFDPYNVDDMAEKIGTMLNLSHGEWQSMGLKGRETVCCRFAMQSFIEKYLKLIES